MLCHHTAHITVIPVAHCPRQGSIHWGGAGGKLPPQTPKLSPQNLVTNHGIQEIFGLSHIKSDLKTPQNQKISWGILPQTPYTMRTSVVSYYIHCIVRRFPPKSTFLDRTLHVRNTTPDGVLRPETASLCVHCQCTHAYTHSASIM